MQNFVDWLAATSVSQDIQKAAWLIPLLQTIHILAIAMVVSSVTMIELRVLGLARALSMAQTADRFLPWFWVGLLLLAITGTVLILGEPRRALGGNPAFVAKMVMLGLAVMTALVFQASLRRRIMFWENDSRQRKSISLAAILVLLLWFAIVVAGRWIAYSQAQ